MEQLWAHMCFMPLLPGTITAFSLGGQLSVPHIHISIDLACVTDLITTNNNYGQLRCYWSLTDVKFVMHYQFFGHNL